MRWCDASQQEGSQFRFCFRKRLAVVLMSAAQTYEGTEGVCLPSHYGDCWDNIWTRLHAAEISIGLFFQNSCLFVCFVNLSLWLCYIWSSNFVLKTELREALNLRFSVRLWLFNSGISHPGERRRRSHQCRRTWGILERNWSRSPLSWLHVERVPVPDLIQNHVSFQPQGKKVFCLIT